ncbi:MAG: hypothetical protein IJI50_04310, partial [Ruminococcus sp.]|nr:hypothetical protein [Ruminococcus sp.]
SAPSKLRRTENEQDFEKNSVQKVKAGWRLPRLISRILPKYCHFQQVRISTVTLHNIQQKLLQRKGYPHSYAIFIGLNN